MSQAGKFFLGNNNPIDTLTGNTGGPVGPTGNNINIVGTGTISVAGNPATSTLTISESGTVANDYVCDTGAAVPSGGVLNVLGGNNIHTTGAGSTITIAVSGTTNHSLQLGNSSGSLTSLGVATNGQLPIGSAGADPVLATLTAGTGISITNGAGSITIAASGTSTLTYTSVNHAASPYTVLTTDEYLGVDVTAGVVSILLPNAPSTGRTYTVKDKAGLAGTSNITVTTVGGVVNIDGATSFTMNTNYEASNFLFNGSSWEVW